MNSTSHSSTSYKGQFLTKIKELGNKILTLQKGIVSLKKKALDLNNEVNKQENEADIQRIKDKLRNL
ncbi:hypothetical protein IT408_04265 [Candidatus Uhrbacteria bacterium]|nr:hypothetical protein [Candidatus Uhrbacteria bacterium]